MAHRTNVTQVPDKLEDSERQGEIVTDPVCGREMERKDAKHAIFRGDQVIYFCTAEHLNDFLRPAA